MAFNNPRRLVLHVLRGVNEQLRIIVSDWNVSGSVFLGPDERDPENPFEYKRPRRRDEYPENKRSEWISLAKRARIVAGLLNKLAQFADEQAGEIEQEEAA